MVILKDPKKKNEIIIF